MGLSLLDRLLGHDFATTQECLQLCQGLNNDALDQVFDVGWGTLRKTFDHMISNIEVWTDLMMERPVRSNSGLSSVRHSLKRLEQSYPEFADFARQVESEGRLDALFTDVLDKPPTQKSLGGAIGHVITHNMHHRAEILHIMHRLNIKHLPEGDLMGWDQRQSSG